MAEGSKLMVSSEETLLAESKAMLTDMATTLLLGVAATFQEASPSRLDSQISDRLDGDRSGKTLAEALGNLAFLALNSRT